MYSIAITLLYFSSASVSAYKAKLFDTRDCTGNNTSDIGSLKVSDGCKKIEGDIKGSIFIEWEDGDNDVSFNLNEGDRCCIPFYANTLIWQDECASLEFIHSVRVVKPGEEEKGKDGEKYDCTDDFQSDD